MFVVYILSSEKIPRTYTGYADNLEKRLWCHNNGRVAATKFFRPWKVIYTEPVNSLIEARVREKYWKSHAGRINIKKIFAGSRPTFRKKVGRGSSNP